MQETPKSSRFFDPLAIAVASGSTIKAAAEAAGCSTPVAYSISRSPEFKNAVSEYSPKRFNQPSECYPQVRRLPPLAWSIC